MAEDKGGTPSARRSQGWEKWIKDHKLGIPKLAQQIIAAVVALAVAAGAAYLTKKSDEEVATAAVAELRADSTLENFKAKLGGGPQLERRVGRFRELVWINDIYAVKALLEAGMEGVVGYTVTTRTPSFTPPIPLPGVGNLGEARFSDVSRTAYCRAGRGFGGYWYYDEALSRNAYTNYETLLLGTGWSGLGDHSAGSHAAISTALEAAKAAKTQDAGAFRVTPESEPGLVDVRKQLIITTYGHLSENLQLRELPETFMLAPSDVDHSKYPAKR